MSGLRGVFKDGWHPKGREGGRESWRGDFKGLNQVTAWVGGGKDKDTNDRSQHVSRPLSSLKDPASFGPPPKHIHYHGPGAAADRTTAERRGLGAPLSQEQIRQQQEAQRQAQAEAEEENAKPAPPPRPYRVDTTGLSTSNLPPPPTRTVRPSAESVAPQPKPKPSLPPRLPPRTNSGLSQSATPPPAYSEVQNPGPDQGGLNPDAVSRLGQAGVSVPGLGIGGRSAGAPAGADTDAPVNELQARLSQMSTQPPPPARRTPPNVGNDASSVAPASGFRQRHGDQIEAGMNKIRGLNEKYGITKRFNSFVEDHRSPASAAPGPGEQPPPQPPRPQAERTGSAADRAALNKRKPPPPPPPRKKPEMQSPSVRARASPPPLPLDTKPRC
ncbi:hypothetical protein VTN02DRAFT_372 [Thermoascus thermophilus]